MPFGSYEITMGNGLKNQRSSNIRGSGGEHASIFPNNVDHPLNIGIGSIKEDENESHLDREEEKMRYEDSRVLFMREMQLMDPYEAC